MSAIAQPATVLVTGSSRGIGRAIALEAAAAGKPVVTTDVIGCREAILPGETGLLVPARFPLTLH